MISLVIVETVGFIPYAPPALTDEFIIATKSSLSKCDICRLMNAACHADNSDWEDCMMWIAFAVGWILGSASLYAYMVLTAREPQREECMECRKSTCDDCPALQVAQEADLRRAA